MVVTLHVLDLFSGIGGFSLGLERAGMRLAAFCEINPFCRQVLAKHWPGVPIYDDVRTHTGARLAADGDRGMTLCNDCRHCARSPSTDAHLCKRQPALLDLVGGHKIYPLCSEERFGRNSPACGQMGKLFEKAEVA